MTNKEKLRKKYLRLRKKKYFDISEKYFKPLIDLLNRKFKNKPINVSVFYPSNYEVNTLKFFKLIEKKKNITTLLPSIKNKNNMKFYKWKYLDPLKVNKYGMLEPATDQKSYIPNVSVIPLLAFDENNDRLGYGKGYYDNFLNKYLKMNKKILTVGVAFSFQKYNKLPTSSTDVNLDYILTEKRMQKV